MKLSIVIPALNERASIAPLHSALLSALAGVDAEPEFIFVDDGSTDGTPEAVRELMHRDPRVKLVALSRNFGHQIAITAGLDRADGDAVVTMDADLQHPPALIPRLLDAWRAGAEHVYTVRRHSGDGGLKALASRLFYWAFRRLSHVELPANAADFRLMDAKLVAVLRGMRERHRFVRGLVFWAGFRTAQVEYDPGVRVSGRSRYTLRRMVKLAVDGIMSFSTAPLYLVVLLGFLMAMLGVLYFLYALYSRFVTHAVIQGWTSVISSLLVIGGVELTLMGMVGLYVGKIYEEVKARPLYVVRETAGF